MSGSKMTDAEGSETLPSDQPVDDETLDELLHELRATGKYKGLLEEVQKVLEEKWKGKVDDACNAAVREQGAAAVTLDSLVAAAEAAVAGEEAILDLNRNMLRERIFAALNDL